MQGRTITLTRGGLEHGGQPATEEEVFKSLVSTHNKEDLVIQMKGRAVDDAMAGRWARWFEAQRSWPRTAWEVNFSTNSLTSVGLRLILQALQTHQVRVGVLKLYQNKIEHTRDLVAFLKVNEGRLRELHLSHNRLPARAAADVIVAVATATDPSGRPCYPRRSPSCAGAFTPLWLRVENNGFDGPALRQELQADASRLGKEMKKLICQVDGGTPCCPAACRCYPDAPPPIHLTYMPLGGKPQGQQSASAGPSTRATVAGAGPPSKAPPLARAVSDRGPQGPKAPGAAAAPAPIPKAWRTARGPQEASAGVWKAGSPGDQSPGPQGDDDFPALPQTPPARASAPKAKWQPVQPGSLLKTSPRARGPPEAKAAPGPSSAWGPPPDRDPPPPPPPPNGPPRLPKAGAQTAAAPAPAPQQQQPKPLPPPAQPARETEAAAGGRSMPPPPPPLPPKDSSGSAGSAVGSARSGSSLEQPPPKAEGEGGGARVGGGQPAALGSSAQWSRKEDPRRQPAQTAGLSVSVKKHSSIGCAVVTFSEASVRDAVLSEVGSGVHICGVAVQVQAQKVKEVEVPTELWAAWGRQVEKSTPVPEDAVLAFFEEAAARHLRPAGAEDTPEAEAGSAPAGVPEEAGSAEADAAAGVAAPRVARKTCVAVTDYAAEAEGYLTVRRGERIRVLEGEEPGDPCNRYSSYVVAVQGGVSGYIPKEIAWEVYEAGGRNWISNPMDKNDWRWEDEFFS